MVNVHVIENAFLFYGVKIGDELSENGKHLLRIASKSRINEKIFTKAFDDRSIASARRLNSSYFCVIGYFVSGDPRRKAVTLTAGKESCEFADTVKGTVG